MQSIQLVCLSDRMDTTLLLQLLWISDIQNSYMQEQFHPVVEEVSLISKKSNAFTSCGIAKSVTLFLQSTNQEATYIMGDYEPHVLINPGCKCLSWYSTVQYQ